MSTQVQAMHDYSSVCQSSGARFTKNLMLNLGETEMELRVICKSGPWTYTSMESWRRGPTSTTCCRHVSLLWGRSNPSSGFVRHTHWPLWSPPWYTVGLTTVTSYSLVSPTVTFSACTTLLVCFAIIIGFLSNSVLSIQAVHDCSPLPVQRSTTLFGRPHHAVCLCRSAILRHHWPLVNSLWLHHVLGIICLHHFVEFIPLTLKTFILA